MTTCDSNTPTEEAPSLAATGEHPGVREIQSASRRGSTQPPRAATHEARTIHAARDLVRLAGGAAAAKQVIDDLGS
jgi:hypothetical protein